LLHVLNACLLYALGIRLRFQRIFALLAALLWALHPVQTEAITYMSGTADPLCGMFLIAGILVLAQDFSRRRVAGACVLFMLALLSKETAVIFPLLVMGLIFYRREKRWSPRTYLKTWPFWLITALYFLTRDTLLNFNGFLNFYNNGFAVGTTVLDRFYTFLATLPAYLRLLVWPTGLRLTHNFPIYRSLWTLQTMEGAAILAAVFTGILWKPSRPATPLAWGILWAAAAHIPQSGILVPSDAIFLEHWLYLPTMGLFLGLGENLGRLLAHQNMQRIQYALMVPTALIACLFGVMTFEQNKLWRDSFVFYNHIFNCGEDSPKLRNNLGSAYENKRQFELAIEQYRLALTFSDNIAEAHYNLGASMLAIGQGPTGLAESMRHFQRALELDPDLFPVYDELADVYAYQGDHVKELEYRAKASAIRKRLGVD
jgi:tetratricopeptide (TPR) repeat protein